MVGRMAHFSLRGPFVQQLHVNVNVVKLLVASKCGSHPLALGSTSGVRVQSLHRLPDATWERMLRTCLLG
jgi:hypothetical protein